MRSFNNTLKQYREQHWSLAVYRAGPMFPSRNQKNRCLNWQAARCRWQTRWHAAELSRRKALANWEMSLMNRCFLALRKTPCSYPRHHPVTVKTAFQVLCFEHIESLLIGDCSKALVVTIWSGWVNPHRQQWNRSRTYRVWTQLMTSGSKKRAATHSPNCTPAAWTKDRRACCEET